MANQGDDENISDKSASLDVRITNINIEVNAHEKIYKDLLKINTTV